MQERIPISKTTKLVITVAFVLYSAYNIVFTALQDYVFFISDDRQALGISFGIFLFSAVISRILSGWILEKIDDAVALVAGNIVLTFTLGVYPFASVTAIIYAIRAIQGFGWALSTVTILTMITENTQNSRVSNALGYLNGFGSLSLMIFPALGSWIVAIESMETFTLCFVIAFMLSILSSGLSLYVWRIIPPIIEHDEPISGFPERATITPTVSAFLLFMIYGILASYSPEIAARNNIENPGIFFTILAFAQIIGSVIGGVVTSNSRYREVAVGGGIFVVGGVFVLAISTGIIVYIISALAIGFGLASGGLALNSYVSNVSINSKAKGMALYSAGCDTSIAIGSFSAAILLGWSWGIPSILFVFAITALISSIYSFFAIERKSTLTDNLERV